MRSLLTFSRALILLALACVSLAPRAGPAPAGPARVILVAGDSLSAEYGIARGTGWVPLLGARLAQRYPNYQAVNASISGDTTHGGLARLPALLKRHAPAIVILELGANDALRGLPLTITGNNLRAMADMAREAGARVLIAGMRIPPNYGPDYTQKFAGLFPAAARAVQAGLIPFLLEGIAGNRDMFQADGIHPVAAAQPLLLENVWRELEPMLQTH
jgi:acyl-CoA thioesterase-1